MKTSFLSALLFLVAAPLFAQTAARPESHETPIRDLIKSSVQAWNDKDAAAFASAWDEDGDLINPQGDRALSREQVRTLMARDFAATFADTSASADIEKIRFITDRIALVDMKWNLAGRLRLSDGGTQDGAAYRVFGVLEKKGSAWRYKAVRAFILAKLQQSDLSQDD